MGTPKGKGFLKATWDESRELLDPLLMTPLHPQVRTLLLSALKATGNISEFLFLSGALDSSSWDLGFLSGCTSPFAFPGLSFPICTMKGFDEETLQMTLILAVTFRIVIYFLGSSIGSGFIL